MSPAGRSSLTCLRCSGRLESGYLLDKTDGLHATTQWIEGEPVKSLWFGLKLRGLRKLKVTSLRCRSCGFLELYAPE